MKSWKRWLVIGAIAGVVGAVGGPWLYINLIRADAPTPLTDTSSADASSEPLSSVAPGTTEGTWTVASGSQVGYRVDEVLFGQNATAVGRTDDVTGSMEVDGTTITTAMFTADMTTVASDESRRDNQFRGRIMDTSTYPTASFELSEPIAFDDVPAEEAEVTKTVTGELTLRGTTKTVQIELTGSRSNDVITVKGSVPIVFADWNIPSPSFGPVTTEDNGVLEFSLNLTHA